MNLVPESKEAERLEALNSLRFLRSERQPEFDAIVETVATIFDCRGAFLSLVGENELRFLARYGLDLTEVRRDFSPCQHTISGDGLLVIPNTQDDDRFKDSPLVTGHPFMRFYSGCPISPDGRNRLGALCVIDNVPRSPTDAQLAQLQRLGTVVEGLLRARRESVAVMTGKHDDAIDTGEHVREANLHAAIASVSGVGGWQFDIATNTLTWTDETRQIHDVGPDFRPTVELALSFYAPESRPFIREAVKKGMSDGEGWEVEVPFVTAKGRKIWVRSAGRPVRENGEIVRLVGALQDITERKQAEQALRHSEAVQSTTLETLSEGVLLLDRSGHIQSFNPAAAELLGLVPEALKGRRIQDLDLDIDIDKTSAGKVADADLKKFNPARPEEIDDLTIRIPRTGSSTGAWLKVRAKPISSSSRFGLDGVVISLTDITETKRHMDTLQAVFENMPNGLVYYDENQQLAAFNKDFQRLLQLPAEFVENRTQLQEIAAYLARRGDYGPGDPDKLLEERLASFKGSAPHVYERTSPDGTILEVRGIPLPNGGLVTSFFDITNRKRSEFALRQSEAVHRTTLDTLSEGILLLSHSGEILSANPAAIKLIGITDRDLSGRDVGEPQVTIRCEIEGLGECPNLLALAAADPSQVSNVVACLPPDSSGLSRWIRVNAHRVGEDSALDPDGIVVSLTDITESKQQSNTLQAIFENFPGGIVHYDENLRLSSSNTEFGRLLNYPSEFIDSRPHLFDFLLYNARRGDYGPGDPDELARDRFALYDLSKQQVFERRTADGSYIETRSTPMATGGWIHNFFDITERKRIEEQLAENERQSRARTEELEAILANMRQGVSVFDKRGRLALWNRQYIDIFGKPENEIRAGVSLVELIEAEKQRGEFDGDVQEHVMDLMFRLSEGEVVRSKFRHPNGKIISAVHAPLPGGGWIGTHEDITEREQAAREIEFAAHHDMLTGLANRTLFTMRLDQLIADAVPDGRKCELMLLDLDRFKPVNDTFGHDAGDELLKQVASRLKECVRSSDLIARLGGDEFGILLTGTKAAGGGTAEIAERIVRKIGVPFTVQGHTVSIGVSIGIAAITGDVPDARPIIKRADIALYQVKEQGRNGYRFFAERLPKTTASH